MPSSPRLPSCLTPLLAVWICGCVVLLLHAEVEVVDAPWTLPWNWAMAQQVLRIAYWALMTPAILWLLLRYPISGPRRYVHLLLHLSGAVFLSALFVVVRVPLMFSVFAVPPAQRTWDLVLARLSSRDAIDPLIYFCVVFAHVMIEVYRNLRAREIAEARLRQQLAESELHVLRQQVKPHFLFNALNAVATLVRCGRNSEAVRMLGQLGDLHRRLVESGTRLQGSLEAEFDFARDYLGIERVRFGSRLETMLDLPDDCRGAIVPPLILQPLVENAVKHGAARRVAGGQVKVAARREGNRLLLEVQNPLADDEGERPPGTGAGLRLTWRRLEQGYGADARCVIEKGNGVFVARVELPFVISGNQT